MNKLENLKITDDRSWKHEDGRWKMEDGSTKHEARCTKMETEDGSWKHQVPPARMYPFRYLPESVQAGGREFQEKTRLTFLSQNALSAVPF